MSKRVCYIHIVRWEYRGEFSLCPGGCVLDVQYTEGIEDEQVLDKEVKSTYRWAQKDHEIPSCLKPFKRGKLVSFLRANKGQLKELYELDKVRESWEPSALIRHEVMALVKKHTAE